MIKGDEETETALAHPGDKGSGSFLTRRERTIDNFNAIKLI